MPVWAISLIVTVLQKLGVVNWLEGIVIKAGLSGLQDLKKVKTYSKPADFPPEKDNTFNDPPPSHEL